MSKVIITGGAGFIGSNLADKLYETGHDVLVLDNYVTGDLKNIRRHIRFEVADISHCELPELQNICQGAEHIYHLAATPSVQQSIKHPTVSSTDVTITVKMLEVARSIVVDKFIFSSSCSVYGDCFDTDEMENNIAPKSPYALSKYQGEQFCQMYSTLYNLDTVCLRYFNVYGKRMPKTGSYKSVLSTFNQAKEEGKPLNIVNDGEQRRDFIHVDDVVEANIRASKYHDCYGCTFNIGTGTNYSVNEIADMFGGEKVYGETRMEARETLAKIGRAKKDLKWEPTKKLPEWIRSKNYG